MASGKRTGEKMVKRIQELSARKRAMAESCAACVKLGFILALVAIFSSLLGGDVVSRTFWVLTALVAVLFVIGFVRMLRAISMLSKIVSALDEIAPGLGKLAEHL